MVCIVGVFVCLLFVFDLLYDLWVVDVLMFWWVVYLGFGFIVVVFMIWVYAFVCTSVGWLGLMMYFVLLMVILLGWVLFGEVLVVFVVFGGVVCLVGVVIVCWVFWVFWFIGVV